jgi:hypothetical protein
MVRSPIAQESHAFCRERMGTVKVVALFFVLPVRDTTPYA